MNGQFQCLAKFLLKPGKQNPLLQLKRSYQKFGCEMLKNAENIA